MSIEDIRKEIARRQSFVHDALIGQSPEDLERHWRLMGAQDAFKGLLQFIEENNQKQTDMQKFKFGNPASVVEVSKSPLDRPEPGNRYTIFDCLCRGFGQNNKAPRKTYQVTATTPSAAARLAIGFYRNDFFTDGKENK